MEFLDLKIRYLVCFIPVRALWMPSLTDAKLEESEKDGLDAVWWSMPLPWEDEETERWLTNITHCH